MGEALRLSKRLDLGSCLPLKKTIDLTLVGSMSEALGVTYLAGWPVRARSRGFGIRQRDAFLLSQLQHVEPFASRRAPVRWKLQALVGCGSKIG